MIALAQTLDETDTFYLLFYDISLKTSIYKCQR